MVLLRSLIFNVAFYLNMIALMIFGLPMLLRGRDGARLMAHTWAVSSLWLLRAICGLRVEFRGADNLPGGGYILASKHQSFLETFALVTRVPDGAIILKRSLMRIPLFGLYLSLFGNIGIDRAKGRAALQQIVDQAIPALREGRPVFIYPEGTRQAPGAPPDYKPGVALLYEATASPCVPVALNTGVFWPRRSLLRRPGVAVIEFLPAIPAGLPRRAFLAHLQRVVEAASDRLLQEALGPERAAP